MVSPTRNMAAAREATLLCATLMALFAVCRGSSMCYIANSYYDVCEHGCCGTHPYEECCFNLTGLIIGLVVAVIVIICIVLAVVCFVLHQKSNQVVRMVQSAQSRGDTANITILHMGSSNPYQQGPNLQQHMMTTNSYPNQPSLPPPDEPSGFQPHGQQPPPPPAPSFPPPSSKVPSVDLDPAFPPGGRPRQGGVSFGPVVTMVNGAPGMTTMPSSANEAPGMMPPGMPSSSMNGGPAVLPAINGGPKVMSSSALPQITPRKVPLPSVPVASGGSSPEPPPPVVTAFGAGKGKGGERQREGTSLGATGGTATSGNKDMGVEDIEEIY